MEGVKNTIESLFQSQTRRRLASNFFSLSLIQGANYLIPLLVLPYIVRIIGPEKFGLVTYAQTFVFYFTIVINYGFDYTATRDVTLNRDNPEKLSAIYSSVLFSKLWLFVFSTVVFVVTIFLVDRFNNNWEIYYMSYLINLGFVLLPTWFFQGLERLTNTAVFNFVAKLLFAVFVVALIRTESEYFIYALSNSLAQVLVGLIAFFYSVRYFKVKLKSIPWSGILETLRHGSAVFFSNVVISLYTTTNLVILGFFTTEADYGYFSAAVKITLVTQSLVVLPLGLTLFPHIGKKMYESPQLGIQTLLKHMRWISVVTLIMVVLIFVFAEDLMVILFGEPFKGGVPYLRIMALMPLASAINNMVSVQGLLNLKKDREFFLSTFVTFVFSLTLNFVLVPKYGSTGTAIIILLSEICMTTLAIYFLFMKKENKVGP